MPIIHVNKLDLWYEDQGEGFPLVFLHAFSVDHSMWLPQIMAFSKAGYRVICVDQRGHGSSSAPPAPYNIPQMTADIHELIERLDLGRVCVIGLSMGGRVAMQLGISYPADLKALVLVSTKSEPAREVGVELQMLEDLAFREGVFQAVSKWYERPNYKKLALADPQMVKRMLDKWKDKSPDGFVGSARAILEMEPMSPCLGEIFAPTLAVAGDLDIPCHSFVELYRGSIPHCSVEYIPNAAHFLNVEQPDLFNQKLFEFLVKVRDLGK